MVHTPEGCIIDICTKFEADRSIRSKVIRGSVNFEIWSRDPKPRLLRGHFMVRTQ